MKAESKEEKQAKKGKIQARSKDQSRKVNKVQDKHNWKYSNSS